MMENQNMFKTKETIYILLYVQPSSTNSAVTHLSN
jgi:hypothetical protein